MFPTRPRHIPSEIRKLAIVYNQNLGLGPKQLASKILHDTTIKLSPASYGYLLKKYQITGSVNDRSRPGRPGKLGITHFNYIDELMLANDEMTGDEVKKKLEEKFGLSETTAWVKRLRYRLGWRKAGTKYCQLISRQNEQNRLEFCLKLTESIQKGDTLDDIIFTDESTFQLCSHADLHLTNKRLNHKGRKPAAKHPYKVPEDNDPKHTSAYAKDVMNSLGIKWWKTPSSSPDLNPIEFLWGVMKRKIRKNSKPKSKHEFLSTIAEVWKSLKAEDCRRYIEHISKVIPVVVARRGKASGF